MPDVYDHLIALGMGMLVGLILILLHGASRSPYDRF